ncbi:MAG: hypothetical protein AAF957_17405 [Planctomycetota bacterium]
MIPARLAPLAVLALAASTPSVPSPPGLESLEDVAALHSLVEKAIDEIEELRAEGGAPWVAQGLSELASGGTVREQAQLSEPDWARVQAALRAAAAREFLGAHNVHSALHQLRALEAAGVGADGLAALWAELSAACPKPRRARDPEADRAEHFVVEFGRFVERTSPDVDPVEQVIQRTKAAGGRARMDERDLRAALAGGAATEPDPDEVSGLEGRFWRGDRDELDKLARSKNPRHVQVFDYSTRDDGQLYWELGEGHRPEDLVTPPFVGRMQGVLTLPPGPYRVHVKCDDAVRIETRGSTLLDTWRHAKRDQGLYWHRWFSRDVWLDARNPIVIDTWDGGNAYNLTVRIDRQRPNGSWVRVPFELFHVPGQR